MKPTWEGWPDVIAAQNADVESTAPCLYMGIWNQDHRDWVPEVMDSGVHWDTCSPIVTGDAELTITATLKAKERDLWEPVPEEDTTWIPVQYPN